MNILKFTPIGEVATFKPEDRRPRAGTVVMRANSDHSLTLRFHSPTGAFSSRMPADDSWHAAVVCDNTGAVLALTGPSDDPESVADAELFAGARELLTAAQAAVAGMAPTFGQVDLLRRLAAAIDNCTGANNPRNYPAKG